MTEHQIFELLNRLNNENRREEPINEYTKLIPSQVKSISRSLSNLLYGTNKENNITSINKRTQTIDFIKYLCGRDSNHFSVTEGNYETILGCVLNGDSNEVSNDDNNNLINPIEEAKIISVNKDKNLVEKHNRDKRIAERDRNHLGKEFFVVGSFFDSKSFDETFFELTKTSVEEHMNKSHKETKTNKEILKTDLVGLGYALLNMKRTLENVNLLKIILTKLSSKAPKEKNEIEFVKYVWKNLEILDLEKEHNFILVNFPFLYEEILIDCCKEIIEKTDGEIEIEDFLENQMQLCKYIRINPNLKCSILNVLYELFSISNYNCKILRFIELVNKNF